MEEPLFIVSNYTLKKVKQKSIAYLHGEAATPKTVNHNGMVAGVEHNYNVIYRW